MPLHNVLVTAQVWSDNFNGPQLGTAKITDILKENIQPLLDEKDAEIARLAAKIKQQNNEYIESCFNMQVKYDAEIQRLSTLNADSTQPNRAER